jgi:hypothetical protein
MTLGSPGVEIDRIGRYHQLAHAQALDYVAGGSIRQHEWPGFIGEPDAESNLTSSRKHLAAGIARWEVTLLPWKSKQLPVIDGYLNAIPRIEDTNS